MEEIRHILVLRQDIRITCKNINPPVSATSGIWTSPLVLRKATVFDLGFSTRERCGNNS